MANKTTRRGSGLAALLAPFSVVSASALPTTDAVSPQIRRLWAELVPLASPVAFGASPQPRWEEFVARWGEIRGVRRLMSIGRLILTSRR
jgi:hypothetical protein